MNELFRRLRYLLHRRRFDRELQGDMEFHREMSGQTGGRKFGDMLRLREDAREAWGWMWIDRLGQDLRYAARMLGKSPGFTLAAVIVLAIGIGVNVAAFGFFDLIVLSPINGREPATLLRFHRRSPQSYAYALPYPEMAFFREHSRTLAAVIALNSTPVALEGEERPVRAHFVTANFFRELGATAALGRLLEPTRDDAPDAIPVVVLSDSAWRHHFASDPFVVGRIIRPNGKPATVIGVAPRNFSGVSLDQPALWAPVAQQPYFATGSHLLTDFAMESSGVQMFGRLRPGLTPAIAEAELRSLAGQLHKAQPKDIWDDESLPSAPGGYATSLLAGNRRGTGVEDSDQLYPVAAMIGALCLLILAVTCGNLGSLLLARGVAREREISIRVSVGAGRARLIRQLFTESLLLAALGSAAGLALGFVVLRGLMVLSRSPEWLNPAPDWRVILFAAGTGFAAAILFGLTPALQAARQRHRATFVRQILVGAQVAASCVLLIVAGLLARALQNAMFAYPGFEYRQVVVIDPALANHGYTAAKARSFLDAFESRLGSLPGVESVSLTDTAPLGNHVAGAGLTIDGHRVDVQINRVDPAFFATMKIPLLAGRNFTRRGPGSEDARSVVVSESLARRVWPGQQPLGRKFTIDEDYTVIGIAGSARLVKPQDSEAVEVYLLTAPADLPSMVVVVRTAGPPEALARSIFPIAKTIDPNIVPFVELLQSSFRRKLEAVENIALVAGLLGLVAQLLACLGIVGVVAYAVSQRTREIGLRMALGAKPAHVLHSVLRQFSRPVAGGLLAGILGAAALSQLLRRELYGVGNLDPVSWLAAISLFIATVAVAGLLPARRALRVDPMRALRQD